MRAKLLFLLISLVVIFASCGNKKTDQTAKTTETTMKAPDVDSKMIIIARLFVKPDKINDFTEAAKEMIENSNKEAGCSSYQLYQDPYDNTKFVFVESYNNQAAVQTHFSTEYFKAFGPKISDFITAPAEIKIVTVANEVIQ